MRAMITGGTGFIGQQLSRGALQRGWEITVVTRGPDSAASQILAGMGVTLVKGDVTDRRSFQEALEGCSPDIYFHLAGWYELGIPRRAKRRMWTVNVEGLENALSLAAIHGIPKTVYTSTTTALGDTGGELVDETFTRHSPPLSYYERTKYEAHTRALRHQSSGEPLVIACPAQVMGPGDHSPFGYYSRLFLRGLLPMGWAPEGAFTFGHVNDVAEGLLLAGERGQPGEIYFLAGQVLTNHEMMQIWSQTTGRRPPSIWLPRSLAMAQAMFTAPLLRALGHPAFISPEVVRSSFVSFRYRSDKATDQLGVSFRSAEQAWEETLLEEAKRAGVSLD
ncbi:MAG TPA: NAD-dependent epimerase/dehydratase family protein [Anaerolineae bacterium]|nr:NAD-dependent epimerase/dehydratase family protein [Anaerolineae bacterium]